MLKLFQAKAAVLTCREEATSRKKRLTTEERAAQSANLAQTEASHRRLRGVLTTWRHEATERYDTLASMLESDIRLKPSEDVYNGDSTIEEFPKSFRIHKSSWD